MNKIEVFLKTRIEAQTQKKILRELPPLPIGLADFTSNDYLGLARSLELKTSIIDTSNTKLSNEKNGSTGSRLLSGNSSLIERAELQIASIFKSESSLLFPSGYMANLAVFSSLPQRTDTVLYDEYSHASIKDGIRLSLATKASFKHNNMRDLEHKLKKAKGNIYVAVESIYSMDGDECPLKELLKLTEKYDAHVILDEAHSTGVVGEAGNGLACSLNIENKIPVRIYTFGKAMGIHGAAVACSSLLKQYLINFSRQLIYTTAPDPHSVVSTLSAFSFLKENIYLQQKLQENINHFKTHAQYIPGLLPGNSAIQAIVVPGSEVVRSTAQQLQQTGFDVRAIVSPTVREGSERLRIIIHTFNTKEEIEKLIERLYHILKHT